MKSLRPSSAVIALLFGTLLNATSALADKPALIPSAAEWPMAAGPNGSWAVKTLGHVPRSWSVTTGENIAWKTVLPEGGQSNIAVWGDRLFLTINKPLPAGTTAAAAIGSDVVGCCLNSATGRILWQVDLPAAKPMQHTGLFSDNTSPTPVTNGMHVWFVNAGGSMGCWTVAGKPVWFRRFEARTRHNAKQSEPMLIGNWLLHVEMRDPTDPKRRPMTAKPFERNSSPDQWPWTFIRAFDSMTGLPAWTSEAGTSVHNTPRLGWLGEKPVVFHARGGGHRPPETPYGFSMTSLSGDEPGRTLWNTPMNGGMAYCVSHFDEQFAYAFDDANLVLLNVGNGKVERSIPLTEGVDVWRYDIERKAHRLNADTPFPIPDTQAKKPKRLKKHPTNQSNIVVGDYCLFMSYSGHCIVRVHIPTDKVEYLQVPIQVGHVDKKKTLSWNDFRPADTLNSRGIPIAPDKRARGDGWGHVTSASPIAVNNLVYFSTMLGTVYVIDSTTEIFDGRALVSVNDLGPAGKTWSLSSLSYADGRLFHRGLKHVVSIR